MANEEVGDPPSDFGDVEWEFSVGKICGFKPLFEYLLEHPQSEKAAASKSLVLRCTFLDEPAISGNPIPLNDLDSPNLVKDESDAVLCDEYSAKVQPAAFSWHSVNELLQNLPKVDVYWVCTYGSGKQASTAEILLGSISFDIRPFLEGKLEYTASEATVTLNNGSDDTYLGDLFEALPELSLTAEIVGRVSDFLVDPEDAPETNFLTVTVDRVVSLPDSLLLGPEERTALIDSTGPTSLPEGLFEFKSAIQVPLSETSSHCYVFSKGSLQPQNLEDPSSATPSHIEWSGDESSRSVFVSRSAWERMLEPESSLEVQVTRHLLHHRDQWTDELGEAYRGVCRIPLQAFLQPGVTVIEGEWDLHAADASSFRSPTLSADEIPAGGRSSTSTGAGKKKAGGGGSTKARGGDAASAPAYLRKPQEGDAASAADGATGVYEGAGSRIYVRMQVERPYLPDPKTRKKPESSVVDLLRSRTAKPVPADDGQGSRKIPTPSEEFELEIRRVIDYLTDEYIRLHGDVDILSGPEKSNERVEQRQQRFLYELNRKGRYFAVKEKLKTAIHRIAKEKVRAVSPSSSEIHGDRLYNEVYVQLIEAMQRVLQERANEWKQAPDFSVSVHNSESPMERWGRLADEAERQFRWEEARTFHEERVATLEKAHAQSVSGSKRKAPMDVSPRARAECWVDMAAFLLRCEEWDRAESCLREACRISVVHEPALRTLGLYRLDQALTEKSGVESQRLAAEAEVYLQAAVDASPPSSAGVCWTALAVYMEWCDRSEEYRSAVKWANRCGAGGESGETPGGSIYIHLAKIALRQNALAVAERVLTLEQNRLNSEVAGGAENAGASLPLDSERPLLLLWTDFHSAREDFERASTTVQLILDRSPKDWRAWLAVGRTHYLQGRAADAIHAYEMGLTLGGEALDSPTTAQEVDLERVQCRLGECLLADHRYRDAKDAFLFALESRQTSVAWLGVGVACLHLQDYDHSEQALAQANMLNPYDADVWGYLSTLCLKQRRWAEAAHALSESYQYGLKRVDVLRDIAELYFDADRYEAAYDTLLRAMDLSPDSGTIKCLLGDVLVELKRFAEARDQYREVLKNYQEDEDYLHALEQLAIIARSYGNEEEAAHYSQKLADAQRSMTKTPVT